MMENYALKISLEDDPAEAGRRVESTLRGLRDIQRLGRESKFRSFCDWMSRPTLADISVLAIFLATATGRAWHEGTKPHAVALTVVTLWTLARFTWRVFR